jgi:metal-sulfur cluster biosynthetic enzyme
MTTTTVVDRSQVLAALATVRDPELNEPITSLGFVASCTVTGAAGASDSDPDEDGGGDRDGDVAVTVRLRLPTYFCAPNFAFLMVADAYDAVAALGGVRSTEVILDDHFAAETINEGVAARAGFARSFPGEAAGELDELRRNFLRKAVLAGTDQVCRPLLAAGRAPAELAGMTLGDTPPSADLGRLRQRRAELGLPTGPESPLLVDPATGAAVPVEKLPLHLQRARTTQVGIEANTGICRGMLQHRYHSPGHGEDAQDQKLEAS